MYTCAHSARDWGWRRTVNHMAAVLTGATVRAPDLAQAEGNIEATVEETDRAMDVTRQR
jgi:hypothetical protein